MAHSFRKQFMEKLEGGGRLYEADLLNILLSNAFGGRDTSAVADALLCRFPGVKAIIEAEPEELIAVDGVSPTVVTYLKSLDRAYKLCHTEEIYMRDTAQCFGVIAERFRGRDNESVEIYLVNKSGKVTDIKQYTTKNADRVDVSANEILSVISSSGAYGLYFAHNHVNCPATPSVADDKVTEKIKKACAMCGIKFFDHCIISSTGDKFSYRLSGKIK